MKEKGYDLSDMPTAGQLAAELEREKYRRRYQRVLRSTIYTLVVVAAAAVLVATIWMPVLQIYGSSMTPTLNEGDIVVSVKGSDFEPGDLVAFYIGNKILVKRCIAGPGQWVDIDEDGNVYVDRKEKNYETCKKNCQSFTGPGYGFRYERNDVCCWNQFDYCQWRTERRNLQAL